MNVNHGHFARGDLPINLTIRELLCLDFRSLGHECRFAPLDKNLTRIDRIGLIKSINIKYQHTHPTRVSRMLLYAPVCVFVCVCARRGERANIQFMLIGIN